MRRRALRGVRHPHSTIFHDPALARICGGRSGLAAQAHGRLSSNARGGDPARMTGEPSVSFRWAARLRVHALAMAAHVDIATPRPRTVRANAGMRWWAMPVSVLAARGGLRLDARSPACAGAICTDPRPGRADGTRRRPRVAHFLKLAGRERAAPPCSSDVMTSPPSARSIASLKPAKTLDPADVAGVRGKSTSPRTRAVPHISASMVRCLAMVGLWPWQPSDIGRREGTRPNALGFNAPAALLRRADTLTIICGLSAAFPFLRALRQAVGAGAEDRDRCRVRRGQRDLVAEQSKACTGSRLPTRLLGCAPNLRAASEIAAAAFARQPVVEQMSRRHRTVGSAATAGGAFEHPGQI